jgi:hypothetical protein
VKLKFSFLILCALGAFLLVHAGDAPGPGGKKLNAAGRIEYVDYPESASLNQIVIVTKQVVVDYQCIPAPGNPPSGNVRVYCDSGTGLFTCRTSSGASCAGSATTAFSAISSGTNTTAAMHVGTGATLDATGSGAITATNYTGQVVTINGTSITTIQQAIAALPAGGGAIDARVMPSGSSFDLGTIDSGDTKPIEIWLGCFAYSFTKIVIRNGLHIIGGGTTCTTLNWSSVTVGDAAIEQFGTADTGGVLFTDLLILANGTTANQTAIKIAPNGSLNNSASYHLYERLVFGNFTGIGINIDASLGTEFAEGSISEIVFDHVQIYPQDGSFSVQIKGAVDFGVRFTNCRLEELSITATETAINIISAGANSYPQNILFDNVAVGDYGQVAEVDGGKNIVFTSVMPFLLGGPTTMNGVNLSVGTGTVHSTGIVMDAWDFQSGLGSGVGGFLAKTNDASSSLIFSNNILNSTPTAILSGFTSNVISFGNTGGGSSLGVAVPLFTVEGATSGSATVGAAAIAGTPNQINLPTTTGTSGQVLTTNGANPQQASWATPTLPATTATNCSSSASPAVCGSAQAGSVVIAAGATTVTVNTTAVTANSQILVFPDETLGTKLSVTCNSTLATAASGLAITARTAATSFQISTVATIAVNPVCLSYLIIN